jgi:hypothetical protein
MRTQLQLQLIQIQRLAIEDFLSLFGSENILSYNELRDRASKENWNGNAFNQNLLEAQRVGFIRGFFETYAGYFYEKETMLNY